MGLRMIVVQGTPFLNNLNFYHYPCNVPMVLQLKSLSNGGMYGRVQSSLQGCSRVAMDHVEKCSLQDKDLEESLLVVPERDNWVPPIILLIFILFCF